MTPESIPIWITLIERVGVPVAVLAFVLVRLDRRLADLQRSVVGLTILLAEQAGISMDRIEAATGQHNHKRKDDRKSA